MISRLILSLKRAADTPKVEWTLTDTTFTSKPSRMQFAPKSNRDIELRTEVNASLGTPASPML